MGLAPGASGASSRRVPGRRFLLAPAAAQRLALLAVRGRGLGLGSVTDTVLVLLHGCARPFGPVLGGAPGGLGDAFPQSSWLLRPSPYLQLFPGSRSRSLLLGLLRVSQGGCPGPAGGGEQRGGCVRSTGGLAPALPVASPGRGLAGGSLGPGVQPGPAALWGPGVRRGPAQGHRAGPQQQQRRRAGCHRGNAAAGRAGSPGDPPQLPLGCPEGP